MRNILKEFLVIIVLLFGVWPCYPQTNLMQVKFDDETRAVLKEATADNWFKKEAFTSALLGGLLAIAAVWFGHKWQARNENRKFHNERAVEVIREWALFTASLDPCLIHLARQLNAAEAKALVERKEIEIPNDRAKLFCQLLNLPLPNKGQPLRLQIQQVLLIKAEAMKLLNMLEWCLAVWARISREEMIVEEFSGLADTKTFEMDLVHIRVAAGDMATFPCVVEFESELKKRSIVNYKSDRAKRKLSASSIED